MIGDNVFIGDKSIFLKGVYVGSNVIIGAGSIVAKDIPGNTVVAGNPERVICFLTEFHLKYNERQIDEARADYKAFYVRYGRYPEEIEIKEFSFLYDSIKTDDCFCDQ